LGPLDTAATIRPTVPASGDYDDGEMFGIIGGGSGSTRAKPAPVPLCQPQNPTCCPDANPCRRGGKSVTNCLRYGTAWYSLLRFLIAEKSDNNLFVNIIRVI
jgi:hypothetical protein